jgi:CBS domain-containing protein
MILPEIRFASPTKSGTGLFGIMRMEAVMDVKTILAAKKRNEKRDLGGDIVSIEPTANLSAAAQLLAAHRIGAVVILGAGGRLAGILSERDIVRAISENDAAALALPVGQVMTRNVATCTEDDTVANIMERMTAGKFRHMPVVKKERLVGLISIGDVVKQRVDEVEQESEAMRDYIRTA